MNAKQINTHLVTYKGTSLRLEMLNDSSLTEFQRLAIKNTIMCSAWAYAGPVIMFVFRSFFVKKLKPGWAIAAEALNAAMNSVCEIPQQSSKQ
jgi:hypothetical protein